MLALWFVSLLRKDCDVLSGCFLKYFTSLGFLSSKTLYWLAAVFDYGEMSIFHCENRAKDYSLVCVSQLFEFILQVTK